MVRDELVRIAFGVRQELESFGGLRGSVFEHMPSDMLGFCMFGSVMVSDALKERFHKDVVTVCTAEHFFTVFRGSWIVDVTASQFGMSDVCVVSIRLLNRKFHHFWMGKRTSLLESTCVDYRMCVSEARRMLKCST